MSKSYDSQQVADCDNEVIDNSRRDALQKMGKYSTYTAPALLAMLVPKKGRAGVMSVVSPPA
jgi:hypothetical protein